MVRATAPCGEYTHHQQLRLMSRRWGHEDRVSRKDMVSRFSWGCSDWVFGSGPTS